MPIGNSRICSVRSDVPSLGNSNRNSAGTRPCMALLDHQKASDYVTKPRLIRQAHPA